MNFQVFTTAVAKQFERMSKHQLFRVKVDKDAIYATYLESFPGGSNPLFRQRTEHDCSTCKNFIRSVGDVVAIIDGKVESIWDVKTPSEPNYQVVADALSAFVKANSISDVFFHFMPKAGEDKTFEKLVDDIKTWNHFFVNIPKQFVLNLKDIPSAMAPHRDLRNVFLRGLKELDMDAVETVLDLISQNSLYRGAEKKFAVEGFYKLKKEFAKLKTDAERELFAWTKYSTVHGSIAGIKNDAIGTLLEDLTKGVELDKAAESFGLKMDPNNYKRPKTELVTKAMIEKAKIKVEELGLTSALARRYATIDDITINNVLFANSNTKQVLSGNIFDELVAETPTKVKNLDKLEEIHIDKFLADVLPRATSVEVLLENRHMPNLVSLIAPQDPTANELFKWKNRFSFAYNGDIADSSIRQAVQARGGRVDGVLRCSLSWNHDKRNCSLMDGHVFMPKSSVKVESGVNDAYGNGERVGWNHRNHPASGGVQDVDYTAEAPVGYIPVENITFPDLKRMPEGRYIYKVHNWAFRDPTHGGFKAEIEFGGQVFSYDYPKVMKNKEWVTVAEITLKGGEFTIKHHLSEETTSREIWNLQTQNFHQVNAMMMSPNFWDDNAVGNKHFFFMLEGCKRDTPTRGFFNEFLKEEMTPHRKVLEMVGSKMKVAESDNQLSGLGFSSTQKNSLTVRVKGSFTRMLKIVF